MINNNLYNYIPDVFSVPKNIDISDQLVLVSALNPNFAQINGHVESYDSACISLAFVAPPSCCTLKE
jgi:hypothetical protein